MKKIVSVFLILCFALCLSFPLSVFAAAEGEAASSNDEIAKNLADAASYSLVTLENGQETVYISFDYENEDFAKLKTPAILKAFSKYAFEKQKEFAGDDALFLTQRHIAGETFLHIIGYEITKIFGGENGPFAEYFLRFKIIELNVDENRVSPFVINIAGMLLV